MPKLLVSLTDSEKLALRNYASKHRMSMAASVLLALDNHIPGFRQEQGDSTPIAKDIQVDIGDLDFEED